MKCKALTIKDIDALILKVFFIMISTQCNHTVINSYVEKKFTRKNRTRTIGFYFLNLKNIVKKFIH